MVRCGPEVLEGSMFGPHATTSGGLPEQNGSPLHRMVMIEDDHVVHLNCSNKIFYER